MKRLVGGDFLLDMSPIELELSVDGTTKTAITDNEVLGQLTNLKSYIGKPSMIKPIWCKLINGETDELIVAKGTLAVVDEGEFEINIPIKGFLLTIAIAFTQMLNEDEEPIDDWYIDTGDAEYILISDAQAIGSIEELPIFENIVDAQGHKRFIEGDIADTLVAEGVTISYAKWSLSGTHLMIVMQIEAEIDASFYAGNVLGNVNVPEWVLSKIVPVWSKFIENKAVTFRDTAWSYSQSGSVTLSKESDHLGITFDGATLTIANAKKSTRVQFDLLIDNETPAP